MTATVLLTLGRLPKALDVARGFAHAGWRVVVAEPFGWHLTGLSRAVARSCKVTAPNTDPDGYRRDILAIIERERPALVVPISEETIHVAGMADALPAGTTLFTVSQAALLDLHDKLAFSEKARGWGLAAPQSAPFGSDRARAIAASGPFVVKPRNSASGTGVRFFPAGPLPEDIEGADHLVQERIAGQTISSFSIAISGRPVVSVFYRGVVYDGTVAVCFERLQNPGRAGGWVDDFIARSGHTGFIAFDFVIDTDGRAVAVECNPRATSGIHFLTEDTIAPAITGFDTGSQVFREHMLLQQFFPCLTVTQGSIRRRKEFRKNLKALRAAKDVTWQARDPLPFVLMTPASYRILALSVFKGMSMGEAAIRDIGWFRARGEPGK